MSDPNAVDRPPATIVAVGNPNTGKSTLFNALTGMRQKVGNYPGVTVEHVVGDFELDGKPVRLVDLPGTYSISPQSPDEMVSVDILQGNLAAVAPPDAVLIVVDASNLRRNLFFASQIIELDRPVVIALNMMDVAIKKGIEIDVGILARELGVEVVPVVASRGDGLDDLHSALARALTAEPRKSIRINPAMAEASSALCTKLIDDGVHTSPLEVERALIDIDGYAEKRLIDQAGSEVSAILSEARERIAQGRNLATMEARDRYSWINRILQKCEQRQPSQRSASEIADQIINHPLVGSALFILTMAVVFQAVFAWATPLMDSIDGLSSQLSVLIESNLPAGWFTSFLSEGVVAGVGSVIIFLPQILILFAFIIVLEDSGYMSRAAFLMDRLMRWCGLSGQSFIPMLSSFACAVPGIMGTRVIANRNDRIATIIAAPFMTCSARLPIYALLIAAFVPAQSYLGGLVNLHGLILLGFYFLGMAGGIMTAFVLNHTLLKGPGSRFLLEMPPYRLPNWRSVLIKLWQRVMIFLKRAGTIIFSVAIVVWFLASYPKVTEHGPGEPPVVTNAVEQSYLGRISRTIAPVFAPLGWDWKVTAAVLASFPAREVVIAVLGTIYAVDESIDGGSKSLTAKIKAAKHSDGTTVFTLPMAIGLMVFYAFCLQCAATIAVMRRETNTWRWPLFAWFYMSGLGYFGALVIYQAGSII